MDNKTEYYSISINLLFDLVKTDHDLFITYDDITYELLYKSGDELNGGILEDLYFQGIAYLYLRQNEYEEFCTQAMDHFLRSLNDEESLFGSMDYCQKSVAVIQEMVVHIGVNAYVIATIEQILQISSEHLKESPGELYQMAMTSMESGDYSSTHCLLLNYIASSLAQNLQNSTKNILKILGFASLLHDVFLPDQKLAAVNSLKFDGDLILHKSELMQIKEHPMKIAKILKNTTGLLPEIDTIVMNHHERPDGQGFPRGLDAHSIPPMACIFIVAQNICELIITQPELFMEKNKLIEMLKAKYDFGNFKAPLKSLLKLLEESEVLS